MARVSPSLDPQARQAAVSRLTARLTRHHSPRLTMMLVVACAAGIGFLVSASLLWMRVRYMPVRYGVACLIGYGVFLALMNRWLGHHSRQSEVNNLLDAGDVVTSLEIPGVFSGGRSGGGGASASFDAAGVSPPVAPVPLVKGKSWDLDLDEGGKVLPLLAVIAIVAGLVACGSVIWSAPGMLAELLVDGAVAGAAYGRLRRSRSDWTLDVVRRTWMPATALIATFVLLGLAGHYFKPDADSIGDFFR
jgi:hypothetical protein